MKSLTPFVRLLPVLFLGIWTSLSVSAQQTNPPTPAQPAPQPAAGSQPADQQPSLEQTLQQSQQANPAPQAAPGAGPNGAVSGVVTPSPSIASVSLEGVSLSGSLSVEDGRAFIGNNGSITAGDKTAHVALTRGGNLDVCASTRIQLSTDNTTRGGALMIAIDRGALEAHYLPGQYSDVVLTPDLRILISGPGQADLSLRVNNQGDTCVDNHGAHAPYVLASNLFEGGAYRVQPNQRVLFERGSVRQVVDNETEPCGCPPPAPTPAPTAIADVGKPGATLHESGQSPTPPPPSASSTPAPTSTPSSAAAATAAQNPFPLAESEGLKPPPATPAVPSGETHTQVTAPLVYNGETSENVGMPASSVSAPNSSSGSAPAAAKTDPACNDPLFPGVVCDSGGAGVNVPPASPPNAPAAPAEKPKKKSNAFARFLHKVFG